MSNCSISIEDTDLARAWARAFLMTLKPGRRDYAPVMVTVSGIKDGIIPEDMMIRHLLDDALAAHGLQSSASVSNTIFPHSLWNPRLGRMVLFDRYSRIAPALKREDSRNRYGTYFGRLIAYGDGPKKINQLDRIIHMYLSGNRRRSALQVSVFDPHTDQTNQRQRGFPCLHQIAFSPSADGELAITGFYATQYMFERAYGNYLGLCNLGLFVSHELGLKFTRMTCVAAVGIRDVGKKDIAPIAASFDRFVNVASA